MKTSYVVLSLLIASIIASSAIPVSASHNLLQNPGFETGDFPLWDWDWWADDGDAEAWISDSTVHSGSYAVGMDADAWEAEVWMWQDITPQCAKYLEFWYIIDETYVEWDAGLDITIHYSDGFGQYEELDHVEEWTLVHIDLDTNRHVKEVELELWVEEAYLEIYVDDFYLEACPVSPVGGELLPKPFLNPVMAVAVIVSIVALTAKFGCKIANR